MDVGAQFVSGVVLAAGFSRRSMSGNKLLARWDGIPVVRRVVEAMCGAGLDEVVVVTGFEAERVADVLTGLPVRHVRCEGFAGGMGCSLAAGIREASHRATGFAVCPGDLPRLSPELIRRIVAAFLTQGGASHIVPTAGGVRGHPVVLGAWLRKDLESLAGDRGARRLLQRPEESLRCRFVEVGDGAIHGDVDVGAGQPG